MTPAAQPYTRPMSGIVAWVASSGIVQGVIIGAALAFLGVVAAATGKSATEA